MRVALLLAALMLGACSAKNEEERQDSVLLDAAKTPIDKAEAVEEQVLDAAERVDEAIEESGD